MKKTIVHIVGTGTIGEPLIGLFTDFRDKMGIDEVTFHKRTPLGSDRSKINHLMARGARLATDDDQRDAFEKMGHAVSYEAEEAIARATVVVDCTPAGNDMKAKYYDNVVGPKGFLAQGSEFGFGKPYARGVNDEALVPGEDRFIQIVSCNTHNITTLVKTLGQEPDGRYSLMRGNFVCMRRANDISQTRDFAPAPQVGKHDDAEFGTHHAHDAYHLFETLGLHVDLFSSAVKLNTQYMHSIWFNFLFDRDITKEEMVGRLKANVRVATTDKRNCNEIFSFGRDHGYYGRILSQTVVVVPTLAVRQKRELFGFCFTPQDGNSLLSSVAAALWLIDPDQESVSRRLEPIRRWVYTEI
jgi:glyceraldehyde-3-phosphate dehydrogenase/erythrose-4-phosphate dehydrogenase